MVSLNGEHDCMRRKKHGSLLMTASMPPAAAYFRPWITWIIARQGFLLSHASISFFNTPPIQTLTTSTSKSQRRSNRRNRLWSLLATTLSCYGSYISTYGIRLLHIKATSHMCVYSIHWNIQQWQSQGLPTLVRLLGRFKKQKIYIYTYIFNG